jgi:hypothetical protein
MLERGTDKLSNPEGQRDSTIEAMRDIIRKINMAAEPSRLFRERSLYLLLPHLSPTAEAAASP